MLAPEPSWGGLVPVTPPIFGVGACLVLVVLHTFLLFFVGQVERYPALTKGVFWRDTQPIAQVTLMVFWLSVPAVIAYLLVAHASLKPAWMLEAEAAIACIDAVMCFCIGRKSLDRKIGKWIFVVGVFPAIGVFLLVMCLRHCPLARYRCSMACADLRDASLKGVDLTFLPRSALRCARAQGANLREANLTELDLERVDFTGAQMEGATLVKSDLRGAVLDKTHLDGAHLDGADLTCVRLIEARMKGALLNDARADRECTPACGFPRTNDECPIDRRCAPNFTGADLSQARLTQAPDAGLAICGQRVMVNDAKLEGVDLCNVSTITVDDAGQPCGDDRTRGRDVCCCPSQFNASFRHTPCLTCNGIQTCPL
jgi:uncharacterized protein YjbI with pentapeptide repeats